MENFQTVEYLVVCLQNLFKVIDYLESNNCLRRLSISPNVAISQWLLSAQGNASVAIAINMPTVFVKVKTAPDILGRFLMEKDNGCYILSMHRFYSYNHCHESIIDPKKSSLIYFSSRLIANNELEAHRPSKTPSPPTLH